MRLPFRRRPTAIEGRTAFRTDYGGQAVWVCDPGLPPFTFHFSPFTVLQSGSSSLPLMDPRHALRSDCFEKQHSLQNFSNQTETESYRLDTER